MLDLEQHVEQMQDHMLNWDAIFVNNVDKMVVDKLDNHIDLLYEYFQPKEQNYNSDN
jgi:hypothetical protein